MKKNNKYIVGGTTQDILVSTLIYLYKDTLSCLLLQMDVSITGIGFMEFYHNAICRINAITCRFGVVNMSMFQKGELYYELKSTFIQNHIIRGKKSD